MQIFSKNKNHQITSDSISVWLEHHKFYPYSSRASSSNLNNLYAVIHGKIVVVYCQIIYLARYTSAYADFLEQHGFMETQDYRKILDKVLQVFNTPVACQCGNVHFTEVIFPTDINRNFLLNNQQYVVSEKLLAWYHANSK
jgi:hypothetical protein